MKVSELELGMMIEPQDRRHQTFIFRHLWRGPIPYITVRFKSSAELRIANPAAQCTQAVYLGDRKAVKVGIKDFPWSNRFVLVDGQIAAVDPSAWIHIKRAM